MLRTLLSPISSRFPLSPRPEVTPTPADNDELTPEDFARDVLVEIMRNAVERLKVAQGLNERTQVLVEVHGIMVQDACTKDVFREMDGFLVLMSVLSTIQPGHSWTVAQSGDQIVHEVLEAVRLVFAIISEAMDGHKANTAFFERSVGYDSLGQAVLPLASDLKTVEQTLGFIVSLGVHNFSLSGMFLFPEDVTYEQVDAQLHDSEPMLKFVRHAGAIRVAFSSMQHFPEPKAARLRYSVLKLLERLTMHSHRNHAILTTLDLIGPLFDLYYLSAGSEPEIRMSKPERQAVLRLLKRLLELGSDTHVARIMFQRAVNHDETLNGEILELLRAGMKTRWPEHMSMEGSAAINVPTKSRGLPSSGFTLMLWLRLEHLPSEHPQTLFAFHVADSPSFSLQLHPGGILGCQSNTARELPKFKPVLQLSRWTHVTLVHYPHRASAPTVRLFIDGVLSDAMNWQYPKHGGLAKDGTYIIGDATEAASMSWAFASAYLVSTPLGDDIPRFVQHLGPRYAGRFQAIDLAKFMTYEATTSLSIFLSTASSSKKPSTMSSLIKDGLGINPDSVLLVLTPSLLSMEASVSTDQLDILQSDGGSRIILDGDVVIVRSISLDLSMWRLGGPALPLRLVQLAQSSHELSRTLAIMAGGLRNDWQNSDDMERIRGYEILADILRHKSYLINMTGFETLFEFLGLSFRSPDQSTVINSVAYRAIALDLQLWAQTKTDIQQAHLEHFSMLLRTSKYKKFNVKQRLGKMNVVRKFLFALQTDWYQSESLPWLVETLKVAAEATFSTDDVIKPIVAYLAANLHPDLTGSNSPQSVVSRFELTDTRLRAEQVFKALVMILQSQSAFTKFTSSLPLTRICLLLLGDRPSPVTAANVLRLIENGHKTSSSFSRKFELISGWNTLKAIIPQAWDQDVQVVAFDVLLGGGYSAQLSDLVVVCSHMLPVILACLRFQLEVLSGTSHIGHDTMTPPEAGNAADSLLEELIKIHSFSPTFRQAFQSQVTTQTFIDAFKAFVLAISMAYELENVVVRVLEKLSHLALSISLDNVVAVAQSQEILDILQTAESVLNPTAVQHSSINPSAIMNSRARHTRRQSTQWSIHLGHRTVQRSSTKIQDWRKNVTATERKRLRKNILDLREQRRQITSMNEWAAVLTTERGLWSTPEAQPGWRLDETEGPYRVRKKLEPEFERAFLSKVDKRLEHSKIQEPSSDAQSIVQAATPPWAESYDMSSSHDDRVLDEEVLDDKHRRVRHELEPGDVIDAAETVARISGIDSFPGLLIFGRTHLYMLDGLVQSEDGEVIDARDAPKALFLIPGSAVNMNVPQKAQRWPYDQVASFSDRTFLFRGVALEIYFKDSRSLLVVFTGKDKRQAMGDKLTHMVSSGERYGDSLTPGLSAGILKSPMVSRLSARVSARVGGRALMGFRADELSTAQRKWQAREISNFTYISILNQISGRTPSDATQYPVFPWVLSDYTSTSLDLESNKTFRDLTRPMGALTEGRREAAEARYSALQSVDEKPFHYGTHFSSSMIVCHFLIRMEPFTHMFKTLQGGDWDLPDRLFSDMKRAFESASQDLRGDVRELIPEFYTCPEFLENSANLDFGVQQGNGERIHHVKLPLWAKQDPLLFVTLNRQALESDYVSHNLPAWIDLIWGYKQRDPDSLNVFHPLSYEGSIDLDSITDELEREATVGIIHNFGQTPRKLFNTPHPDRMMHGASTLPIGSIYGIPEDYHLLSQSSRPVRDLGNGKLVSDLAVDLVGERIIPCPAGVLAVPSRPHETVEWDPPHIPAGELRVLVDKKPSQVVESALCSCAVFADADTLVTGSTDYTVRLWKLTRGAGGSHRSDPALSVNLTHIMRGHSAPVACVAASRAWSLVVSGSQDGSASLWELNRGVYVRSIWHGDGPDHAVHLAAIQESTGHIATCSQDKLWLHTVNARLIAVLDLTDVAGHPFYPPITSLAFHEREYTPTPMLATGSPDGTITLRTWNTDSTPEGEKAVWQFVALKKMKVKVSEGGKQTRGSFPCITALRFVGESLYHGEDTGKAYSWNLPD